MITYFLISLLMAYIGMYFLQRDDTREENRSVFRILICYVLFITFLIVRMENNFNDISKEQEETIDKIILLLEKGEK